MRDVRWRAMKSIVFKLSYRAVSLGDLVRDRTFHRHLLEWFNFSDWGCESLVLDLLRQLTPVTNSSSTISNHSNVVTIVTGVLYSGKY